MDMGTGLAAALMWSALYGVIGARIAAYEDEVEIEDFLLWTGSYSAVGAVVHSLLALVVTGH
jgi:hypothetical protein